MKIKITLRGEIGWDETASSAYLQAELEKANGAEVELEIASPGGYVSEGLEMANMIRNYPGKIVARITGFAASMASYIPMFADEIIAEDNAVFMIHNVIGGVYGDHRDIQKAADRTKRLTALLAAAYVKKTGKSVEEIRALMDDETFLYGQDIVDQGFADSVVEGSGDTNKATAIEAAEVAVLACVEKMQSKPESGERLAAMLTITARANGGHGVPNPQKEIDEMDPKVRAFLESRGLAKDATDDDAYKFMEKLDVAAAPQPSAQPAAPAAPATIDIAAKVQEERARIRTITSLCERAGIDQVAIDAHVTGNSTIEAVRAEAFEAMAAKAAAQTQDIPFAPVSVNVGASSRDKFSAAANEAILFRAGLSDAKFDAGANPFTGYSMTELARQALILCGHKATGSAREVLGQALTTSDLPNVLANVLNKSVFMGFETAEETWNQWCSQGEVSDFKQNSTVRLSEMGDLEQIPEGGEYKYDDLSDAKENYQLGTYGKIIRMSRQMLINDDLSVFSDIAVKRGEMAARKIGDIAYNVLIANAVLSDGVALFAAGHTNLNQGGAAAPSVDSIGAMATAMRLQKDLKAKRRLQIRPEFILAPATIETDLDKVLGRVIGTQAEPGIEVPQRMRTLKVITDARLDDDSTTAWYLAGGMGKTVKVSFLQGSGRRPMLEQEKVWNTDGAEFKTTLDVTAHALAHEALQKNAGA